MAFDKSTRNRLAKFVADARDVITDEFTEQFQSLYGISSTGEITALEDLRHLDDAGLAIAERLRERIDYLVKTHPDDENGDEMAVKRLAREQAFTILNRFAAVRMAEKRGLIEESVGQGYQSKGFTTYEYVAGSGIGEIYERYRRFLFCLFDELTVDLGVLFDRASPSSLLFPRETALLELLELFQAGVLERLWAEDETVGWIYQYYNDPEERKKMREESAAPRNSRELAVRNQFFTPRYVVEFLTDNTLGRIWHEMTRGKTRLKEQCRYLVRRPNEIFLKSVEEYGFDGCRDWVQEVLSGNFAAAEPDATWEEMSAVALALDGYGAAEQLTLGDVHDYVRDRGDRAIEEGQVDDATLLDQWLLLFSVQRGILREGLQDRDEKYGTAARAVWEAWVQAAKGETEDSGEESLSQEELLKQPVIIPLRQAKDPREIRLLDPACGSMHFGLYAFDLIEAIYDEAWDLEGEVQLLREDADLKPLRESFDSKEEYLRQVPRLIIERNIHGVDIDPRAVQIAGLSLWLRAQKSWQSKEVRSGDRPRVRRSNIVCAEPMPGSDEMLEEFVETLDLPLLGELVKTVFEKMELAGEAGTLLKIEEEIRSAIQEAKKAWEALESKPQELFSTEELNETTTQPELSALERSLTGGRKALTADFWETAEQQVLDALRAYAEQVEGDSYQRRLFADDAARGFAFIDLCRKRYDAVVMNPPFGEAAENTTDLIEGAYPFHANNLLCSFLQRAKQISPSGRIGTVLDRTALIKNSYENFRRGCLLDDKSLDLVLDLGWGVLDANVEVSAFVTSGNKVTEVRGWNLTQSEDKALDLSADILGGEALEHRAISRFPFAAVNLQMPVFFRRAVATCPTLSESGCTFYNGHTIKSDVFKRLAWEVCPSRLQGKLTSRMWNGSGYSPFRVAFQECTHISDYAGDLKNHSSTIFRSPDKHGLSGLCFGKRGDYLDVQIQPPGFVLTNEGFGGGITSRSKAYAFLAFLNSRTAQYSINLYCGQHKGVGYVNTLPFPAKIEQHFEALARVAEQGYEITQAIQCLSETDHEFCIPFSGASDAESLVDGTQQKLTNAYRQLEARIEEGDDLVATMMGLSEIERDLVAKETVSRAIVCPFEGQTLDDLDTNSAPFISSIVSYLLGSAFGRWDIRYATGDRQPPELPDPFDPLPVCPPGMLQNAEGLPAEPKDVPADFPLRISWAGILVDDAHHPEDIIARVREAIEVIWKDRAEAIEEEACEILGVNSLRDYLAKPAEFFADHLKRYSKSRRQAPIYWPLSTKSGSYTLWLYYHRLTDQTLHTCLADFLDPKIKKTQQELDDLTVSGKDSARIGELRDFLDELHDLRDEIERIIKLPWKPNLNDGVLITASPLHKLFGLTKWRNDLEKCWKKLEKGDFDWAHLAYSIWPKRVEKACETDRSIAIAHDLEHLCKVEPPKPKKKRAAKKAAKKKA